MLATVAADTCWAGIAEFSGLAPDSTYFYRVTDSTAETSLTDDALSPGDLHFRTLPENPDRDRLDFILLSCHNPEAGRNKSDPESDGFEVWAQIPKILKENPEVRIAVLAGDQVYLDTAASKAMGQSIEKRMAAVLAAYRAHWSNPYYRRVLCSLPAYLMWDDHDIIDGWGSERKAFDGDKLKHEWGEWFETARQAFWYMQACRNADTFGKGKSGPFDSCFRVGNCGFVLADLRSNRNYLREEIWLDEQFSKVKAWIADQQDLDTLFFVSPVVFAHGDPRTEETAGGIWPLLLALFDWLKRQGKLIKVVDKWDKEIGDLRDDLDDAWFSRPNAKTAARVLDYLFGLQNPREGPLVNVVILTGDIHTSGYSNIYSDDPKHGNCAVIPHIVSSPVSYSPFHWFGEAFYRSRTRTVHLSSDSHFKAQVSHHFAQRCATVISLRRLGDSEKQLKVKYYLEGFEEPTTVAFDLRRRSHLEMVGWNKKTSFPI